MDKKEDVFIVYAKNTGHDLVIDLTDKQLLDEALGLAQSSFSKDWDQEDNEYWQSYLND